MRRLNIQARAANGRRRAQVHHVAVRSKDGGTWRGPSEAIWLKQLLRGAPPPRESTGTRDVLVVHG
jgi:hypothetical protein